MSERTERDEAAEIRVVTEAASSRAAGRPVTVSTGSPRSTADQGDRRRDRPESLPAAGAGMTSMPTEGAGALLALASSSELDDDAPLIPGSWLVPARWWGSRPAPPVSEKHLDYERRLPTGRWRRPDRNATCTVGHIEHIRGLIQRQLAADERRRAEREAVQAYRGAVQAALHRLDSYSETLRRRVAVVDVRCPFRRRDGGCRLMTVYRTGPAYLAVSRDNHVSPELLPQVLDFDWISRRRYPVRCSHGLGSISNEDLLAAVESRRSVIHPEVDWQPTRAGTEATR